LILLACLFAFSGFANAQTKSKPRVHCDIENIGQTIVRWNPDHTKAKEEEIEDWYVRCTVKVDDKIVLDESLVYPHPATLDDAIRAEEEWRKKVPQLLKQKSKEK
jgi:hypothetical protein